MWICHTRARCRHVSAKRGGKPPPESASRILASEALNCVKQTSTNKVLLITDGAHCYKSLKTKFGWRHEACNHSAGVFCTKKKSKTDGFWFIPAEWMQCGDWVKQPFPTVWPPELKTKSIQDWCEASGSGNGVIWMPQIISWKRPVSRCTSACSAESEKSLRKIFKTKFRVNYRTMTKTPLIFPGKIHGNFNSSPLVSLWRKRHFFEKRSKRWRGFPPDGMYMYMCIYIYMYICLCMYM